MKAHKEPIGISSYTCSVSVKGQSINRDFFNQSDGYLHACKRAIISHELYLGVDVSCN